MRRAVVTIGFVTAALLLSPDPSVETAAPVRTITLEWAGVPGTVTGVVSAPTPDGPWTVETNFPANFVNRYQVICDQPARYFRSFVDWQ